MVAQPIQRPTTNDIVTYWPRGASAALFREHGPQAVISGPAGTGKTMGSLWRMHLAALKYPGMQGAMLRQTQEDLTASALVTYQRRVLDAGTWGVRPFGGSKLKPAGFQYPNGSEILVGGLDKAAKVMSREYDLVYVNECWEVPEDTWDQLSTRINRPGRVMPWNQLYGDTNPQSPGHWIYKRFLAGRLPLLESVHKDNPNLWDGTEWTAEGIAYLTETLGNLSGHLRDRLLLGLWAAAEGVVYPEFNRQTHAKVVDCDGWATVLTLDVGTRNPTALLTVRHAGDRLHQERELYRRGMSSDDIVDETVTEYERSKASHVVIDPSAAGLAESLRRRGLTVHAANNDVKLGIAQVRSVLADFTIDPSCVETINEWETYAYPKHATNTSDAPMKVNDHAMDAFRYLVVDLTAPVPGWAAMDPSISEWFAAAGVAQ